MSELWSILAIFGLSLWIGFSGAVFPGPMFAATVTHARRWGWRSGVLVSGGHGLLELALLIAIVSGAGTALKHPAVARSIAVAGGLFLIALGVVATARPPKPPSTDARPDEADLGMLSAGWWRPFIAGIWTSATQPYWFIWWVFVGAIAINAASGEAGPAGVGAFYAGHVLADFIWFTFVAAAVGAGRKVLSEATFRRLFVACGAIMVGFGLFFVAAGAFFPDAFKQPRKTQPSAAAATPSAVEGPARTSP